MEKIKCGDIITLDNNTIIWVKHFGNACSQENDFHTNYFVESYFVLNESDELMSNVNSGITCSISNATGKEVKRMFDAVTKQGYDLDEIFRMISKDRKVSDMFETAMNTLNKGEIIELINMLESTI